MGKKKKKKKKHQRNSFKLIIFISKAHASTTRLYLRKGRGNERICKVKYYI